MFLFGKKKTTEKISAVTRVEKKLSLYSANIEVDGFSNKIKQTPNLTINIGDCGYVKKDLLPQIATKHASVGVFINDVLCGYLPYNVGDCVNAVALDYEVSVVSVDVGDEPKLIVNMDLPFVYGKTPISAALKNEKNATEQSAIKQSKVGDILLIKYNGNGFGVYNQNINQYIGDVGDYTLNKIIKSFGTSKNLCGVITKLHTSFDGSNSAYFLVLTHQAE